MDSGPLESLNQFFPIKTDFDRWLLEDDAFVWIYEKLNDKVENGDLTVLARTVITSAFDKLNNIARLKRSAAPPTDLDVLFRELYLYETEDPDSPGEHGPSVTLTDGLVTNEKSMTKVVQKDQTTTDSSLLDEATAIKNAAKTCISKQKDAKKLDKDVMHEGASAMLDILVELNYAPIPYVGHRRSFDTVCTMLYAAASDNMYRDDSVLIPDSRALGPLSVHGLAFEVIGFLHLTGGRPAATQTCILGYGAPFPRLIDAILKTHEEIFDNIHFKFRKGHLLVVEKENWYFQCESDLKGLEFYPGAWTKLTWDTYEVFKTLAHYKKCFIAHKSQINVFGAIKSKQKFLYNHTQFASWTCRINMSLEKEKSSPLPFVPLEFVPAARNDQLPASQAMDNAENPVGKKRKRHRSNASKAKHLAERKEAWKEKTKAKKKARREQLEDEGKSAGEEQEK